MPCSHRQVAPRATWHLSPPRPGADRRRKREETRMAEIDIHVARWGDEGPRIVLVHGSAQGSSVEGADHYAGQQALAARGWQLLLPDGPGDGRSPAAGRPDDFMLDGEWVADLLGDG